MSNPAPAPSYKETRDMTAMTANSLAWKEPENWDGDDYVGPGLPPWGTKQRCPVKRNDRRCRKACIPGGTVCNTHGGAAPQVKKRAALRLMSLIDPAISVLAREMVQADKSSDRQRAANSLLDRAGVGRAAGDMDANAAKAMLMERYHNLQETLARERAEAEAAVVEVEWEDEGDVIDVDELIEPEPSGRPNYQQSSITPTNQGETP